MIAATAYILALIATIASIYALGILHALTRSRDIDMSVAGTLRRPKGIPHNPSAMIRGHVTLLALAATYLLSYFGVYA